MKNIENKGKLMLQSHLEKINSEKKIEILKNRILRL
jgi:hypothetical protein